MHDEEPPRTQTSIASKQLSLFEIFFMMTLCAIAIGVYVHLSQLLALMGGGGLIVVAIVRFTGLRNLVLGGLVGFLASVIVSYLIIVLGQTDTSTSIGLMLLCPAAGYVVGAFLAELRDSDDAL